MINEIINKIPNLEHSQKSDDKKNDRESPVKSELENRSDLRQDDTIEISGLKPPEIPVEKIIAPVSGQHHDVQLLSDVYQKESIRSKEDATLTPGGNDNTPAVEQRVDSLMGMTAEEESSSVDLLSTAYGKKETEVGKAIRMTV